MGRSECLVRGAAITQKNCAGWVLVDVQLTFVGWSPLKFVPNLW